MRRTEGRPDADRRPGGPTERRADGRADGDARLLAEQVVSGMMAEDAFSQWLGVEILSVEPGRVSTRMTVRPEMLNGFKVCHGGVTFAFADSAFAFACNTQGNVAVSIENSMTYPAAVRAGDVLTAVAAEEARSNRILYYRVDLTKHDGTAVGLFRGTAYRTEKPHPSNTEAR